MSEFIVRETDCGLATKQEIVGELVRCKDCYWYEINELKKDGTDDKRFKPSFCVLHSRSPKPNYFCADGERRSDE